MLFRSFESEQGSSPTPKKRCLVEESLTPRGFEFKQETKRASLGFSETGQPYTWSSCLTPPQEPLPPMEIEIESPEEYFK